MTGPVHGWAATYRAGCRCPECRAAHAVSEKRRRAGLAPGPRKALDMPQSGSEIPAIPRQGHTERLARILDRRNALLRRLRQGGQP